MGPAHSNLESLVGTSLAGFRLASILGEGATAVIFLGENLLRAGSRRAIKVVRPELTARTDIVARLMREAELHEQLVHPNIVRFFGVRMDAGYLVLELEFLEGATLAEYLLDGALTGPQAALIVADAARGVAAAHAKGIIHRDLKPGNIFVCVDGSVKVLDFGIAKVAGDLADANRLTMPDTVPGTPGHTAPEILEGLPATPSADVYSLGICLYQALAGHHPFEPRGIKLSMTQMLVAHMRGGMAPIRQIVPSVSPALEAVIVSATCRHPKQRLGSATALISALDPLLEPASPEPAPISPRTVRGWTSFMESDGTGLETEPMATPQPRRGGTQVMDPADPPPIVRKAAARPPHPQPMAPLMSKGGTVVVEPETTQGPRSPTVPLGSPISVDSAVERSSTAPPHRASPAKGGTLMVERPLGPPAPASPSEELTHFSLPTMSQLARPASPAEPEFVDVKKANRRRLWAAIGVAWGLVALLLGLWIHLRRDAPKGTPKLGAIGSAKVEPAVTSAEGSSRCGGTLFDPGNGIQGCWYRATKVGQTCTTVCDTHGGFNAWASKHTGSAVGMMSWRDKKDGGTWMSVECSSTDTNFGANGLGPDPYFSDPNYYVSCACNR